MASNRSSARRAPRGKQTQIVWHDENLRDNPDAPAIQKKNLQIKWARRSFAIIAWGVVPLTALVALNQFVSVDEPPEPTDLVAENQVVNDPAGKAEAYRALTAWLDEDPSPLPGAKVVSWDGYKTTVAPPVDENSNEVQPDYSFQRHSFTVVRGEMTFEASVEVAVGDVLGATATSTPSLTVVPNVTRTGDYVSWFGLTTVTASEDVEGAINTWATALTSGDAQALRQAIQDTDSTHAYVPLYGIDEFRGVDVTAAASATPLGEDTEVDESTILVRVAVSFYWKGAHPEPDQNGNEREPEPVTYDLLIERADTATPVVVAWGEPGSGPELKPYGNAISAEIETVVDDTPTDEADPVAEETTEPADEEN